MEDNAPKVVRIPEEDLIRELRESCVVFFAFYLGEELYMEVPEFHLEIWRELLEKLREADKPGVHYQLRKLFAVPREHSKSTIAKLAMILFFLYSPLQFGLYASKTNASAKNAVRDIIAWLESPQHQALHGPTIRKKFSEVDSLWILEIGVKRQAGQPPIRKTIILKALGAEQQIRGLLILNKRPQICIIDDIEDYANTQTPAAQMKVNAWFMGELLKAFDTSRHFVMFIGNMIRETSLLASLSKLEEWNPTVFGSLVKDERTGEVVPLWPEKFPKEKLLAEYKMFKSLGTGHLWEAEMMNLTHEAILRQDFRAAYCPPRPVQESLEEGFLCLDPAYGKQAWHDESAITVHARFGFNKTPVVIDSVKGHWDEVQLFDELINISKLWGVSVWGIEANAAQKLLIPLFSLMFQEHGLNPEAVIMLPLSKGQQSKASHINAFRAAVIAGSYGIVEEEVELMDALQQYVPDSTEKDDLLDSAAYGLLMWSQYNSTITMQGVKRSLDFTINPDDIYGEILQGYQVEGV